MKNGHGDESQRMAENDIGAGGSGSTDVEPGAGVQGVAARQNVQVAQSPIQSPAPPREGTPVAPTPMPTRETTFESPLPTPTPSPTPTSPVTVVPGPLLPGLKIVCVDKGEDDWTSVIWIANVDDLNHVQVIAKLQNLTRGWGPFGHISPDGRQIAYILPRKNTSESVLGGVNIDGTKNRVLDDPVDGPGVEWLLRWSPDSQWVAYLRRVPPRPESENSEIWLIHILSIPWDASEATTAIRGKEQAYYKPLSWSPDGRFIAAWRYPLDTGPDANIHLVLVGLDGSLRRVYSIEPDFPLPTFVGWLDGKAQ